MRFVCKGLNWHFLVSVDVALSMTVALNKKKQFEILYVNWNIFSRTIKSKYREFNLKVDRILIWVIYLLRFTCYITQLIFIYSKCWKWCPFISVHLSTRFTMFLATFASVLSFTSSMARVIIFVIALCTGACLLNFSKKTLSTVVVRHRL